MWDSPIRNVEKRRGTSEGKSLGVVHGALV